MKLKKREKEELWNMRIDLGNSVTSYNCYNIHIVGVSEKEERKGGRKFIWGNNSWQFSHSEEENTHTDPGCTENSHKWSRTTPRYIVIKFAKYSDKVKILKAARQKKALTYKGTPISQAEELSTETWQARME